MSQWPTKKNPGAEAGAENCTAMGGQTLPGRKAAGVAPGAHPTAQRQRGGGWTKCGGSLHDAGDLRGNAGPLLERGWD